METLPLELASHVVESVHPLMWPILLCVSRTWNAAVCAQRRHRLSRGHALRQWRRTVGGVGDYAKRCVKRGHLRLVQWAHTDGRLRYTSAMAAAIATAGDLDALKWAERCKGVPFDADDWRIAAAAASKGHLKVLEWLEAHGKMVTRSLALNKAAQKGHLQVLVWAWQERGHRATAWAIDDAARGGHLHILQWVHAHCPGYVDPGVCDSAAMGGHRHVLEWAHANGYRWGERGLSYMAGFGDLSTVRWMRERGCPWGETALASAAASGNLELARWLYDNGCPLKSNACFHAIKHRHKAVLEWAVVECGLPLESWLYYAAGIGGDVSILEWLHARSTTLRTGADACEAAAKYGHFGALVWMRAHGFKFGVSVAEAAATRCDMDMLRWLHAQKCPMNERAMHAAACNGDLAMLQWLHDVDCCWDWTLCYAAAARGHLSVIRWALERRCPWSRSCTRSIASQNGHDVTVAWIDAHTRPDSVTGSILKMPMPTHPSVSSTS